MGFKLSYGINSLTYALTSNDYEAADALIAHGADVNAFDLSPPLVKVMQWESLSDENAMKAGKYLLAHGADPHFFGENGFSPLSAASRRNVKLVQLFFDLGLDPKHQDMYGWTALHEAVNIYSHRKNNLDVVKLLLDNGADVGIKDNIGETPLFAALRSRRYEIFEYLLQHGGLPILHEPNKKGNTVSNFFKNELVSEKEDQIVSEIVSRYI